MNWFKHYLLTTVVLWLVLVGLFWTPLFIGQKILLFRGLWLLLIATGITKLIIKRWKIPLEIKSTALVAAVSLNLVFLVLFPVTLDRSVTTYLLNEIDKEDYTTSELREKFVDSYVVNQRAVERRLEEQKVIGLVAGGEKIKLTGGGHIFLQLMEWIKKVYRIDRR